MKTEPAHQGSSLTTMRLESALEGYPNGFLPKETFTGLTRFVLDADALGRANADNGNPLIEEHSLRAIVAELVNREAAETAISTLNGLPSPAFRPAHRSTPSAKEMSWFELAGAVPIFDPSPGASLRELGLCRSVGNDELVAKVQARFPSLESELLNAVELPACIARLLEEPKLLTHLLKSCARQLGWWAAVAAVLMLPPAAAMRGQTNPRLRNVWPLSMFVLATAIGGWTLTVVGGTALASATATN